MGARRRWKALAAFVLVAEVAAMAFLEVTFNRTGSFHAILLAAASTAGTALSVLIPAGVRASLGALLTLLGFGWLYTNVLSPSLFGPAGTGLSTVGGALVAPAYFGVRRLLVRTRRAREPAPEDARPTDSEVEQVLDLIPRAPTGVQDAL